MNMDGKYRFSLQFPVTATKQKAVGEAPEMLGNRKSALVVNAVFQHKSEHPELFSGDPVQTTQEAMIPSTEDHKEQELIRSAQVNQRTSGICSSRDSILQCRYTHITDKQRRPFRSPLQLFKLITVL